MFTARIDYQIAACIPASQHTFEEPKIQRMVRRLDNWQELDHLHITSHRVPDKAWLIHIPARAGR